jgi:hypothetical protein
MITFREWLAEKELNEATFKFRKGMKIEFKDAKLGKEIVKIEQVLKGGDARFYLSDGREMEVSPEDTHLYTYIK